MAQSYKDPTYDALDAQVSKELGLPSGLLSGIRLRGERSNADQVSSAGARTVYQITPTTRDLFLKKYGVDAYKSPADAAKVAGLHLQESLQRNRGNRTAAVREYVGGTNPENYGPVTASYVKRVTGRQEDQPKMGTNAQLDALLKNAIGGSSQKMGTNAQLDALVKSSMKNQPSAAQSLSRGTRDVIEGAAQGAGFLVDPLINLAGAGIRAVTGSDYQPATIAGTGKNIADVLGLAAPETESQKLQSQIIRGATGALTGAGAAGAAARAVTSPVARGALQTLSEQPLTQAIAGGGAGAGAEIARQGGAGDAGQLAGALIGGIGAAGVAGAARAAQQAARTKAPTLPAVEAGKKLGVDVMTSDVLPPTTFIGKQGQAATEAIPVIGTGARRATQQEQRKKAVEQFVGGYENPSYEAIVTSLKGKADRVKSAAGGVLQKTGEQLDAVGNVQASNTLSAIDNAIGNLSKPGVINDNGATISKLQQLRTALANQPQTFTTLKENRTNFRDIVESVDVTGRSQLPSFAKKVVSSVQNALTKDMEAVAYANLSPRQFAQWKRANAVYAEEAAKLTKSRIKAILDRGAVTPEIARGMLFSNKPSENALLYNSLGDVGRSNARSALVNDAYEKAMLTGDLNPNRFLSEISKLQKQTGIFFKGDEAKRLTALRDVLQATKRAQDAAVAPTTTGARLTPYALGAGAIADLGATLGLSTAAAAVARVYESEPVRNALLRLAEVRRGTSAYQNRMENTARILANALRAAGATNQQEAANQ